MYKRVLVGTDLSPTAKVATDRASELASALGAELTVVHAGKPSDPLEALAAGYGAEGVAVPGSGGGGHRRSGGRRPPPRWWRSCAASRR